MLISSLQQAVNSRLHRAENEQFLEHFRYTIVASNLLDEHPGYARPVNLPAQAPPQPEEYSLASWTVNGVAVTTTLPFTIAWLIHWAVSARSGEIGWSRLMVLIVALIASMSFLYVYARKQRLHTLRQNAVKSLTALTTNFEALEVSSSAALTMIQEVELVSRGYRLSVSSFYDTKVLNIDVLNSTTPLPPITRLEDNGATGQSRRCLRIRRLLQQVFTGSIPTLVHACRTLRNLVPQDDLDKYLDIYELSDSDIQEAYMGVVVSEFEDQESLRALRVMQWRFAVLRRVFLCALLSLPADGSKADFEPWKTAVQAMETSAFHSGAFAGKLNDILNEDELYSAAPTTPTHRNSPERERYRQQLRKANELSSELRAMQAKLLLLRDDVNRVLEGQGNVSLLNPLFTNQADSIGQDLKMLNQTYESWRSSLAATADRASHRISRSSSLRSPVSLGGLTVVDEFGIEGGPSDALRALLGESSGSAGSPVASASDEEVFEAIALPKKRRSMMTREEKMAKMQDDETKRSIAREQRQASTNMIRELETVMGTRVPHRLSKRMSTGGLPPINNRISSI
jgi:Mysoin-binding motif of peroxisomes